MSNDPVSVFNGWVKILSYTGVCGGRGGFGFSIVDFVWLSDDVPRLPSYGACISQLVGFADYCAGVSGFHSKNLQITSGLMTLGCGYHKLRGAFGEFFSSYSGLLSRFGEVSFRECVSEGVSHPIFCGYLVCRLGRVKCEANFVSLGSKVIGRLRRRGCGPLIIGGPWVLCLVLLQPCTDLS